MIGKILLVEDNEINQRVFRVMLEDLGCQVDVADNGSEALSKMKNKYDIVVMDIGLPDLNGMDVVATYRAQEPTGKRTTIIALSGHFSTSDENKCLESGMDAFLSKPFMRKDAKAMIDRWVKGVTP